MELLFRRFFDAQPDYDSEPQLSAAAAQIA
jgi:hypothetical protein